MLIFKNMFSFVLTFFAYDWLVSNGVRPAFLAISSIQMGICLLSIPMCMCIDGPLESELTAFRCVRQAKPIVLCPARYFEASTPVVITLIYHIKVDYGLSIRNIQLFAILRLAIRIQRNFYSL